MIRFRYQKVIGPFIRKSSIERNVVALKTFLRSILLEFGLWTDLTTDDDTLLKFVSLLKPLTSSHSLRRIGPNGDGGYLIPDDLEGIEACVSPGVSDECGFDLQLAELGIDIYLSDASVDAPPVQNNHFFFTKKFFDTINSSDTILMEDFCKPISPGKDLILEMDIEGAEYRVLNSISIELLSRFRIMVIEFHNLGQLYNNFGFRELSCVFQKLLTTHNVVHIHPNNIAAPMKRGSVSIPKNMEFTFYRKDRDEFNYTARTYPHALDHRNVPDQAELVLPECWR